MQWTPINTFNAIFLLAILLPNLLWGKSARRDCHGVPKIIFLMENLGRYGCMILMVLPLFVGEFGYPCAGVMVISLGLNVLCLVLYYIFWIAYQKEKTQFQAVMLAVLPTLVFLISGISLDHWALTGAALVFGICHIFITCRATPSPIGTWVTVQVDRPLGSRHPNHADLLYPINYGYIPGTLAPDGEEQDAYILGVNTPVEQFSGRVIAVLHRKDDVEDKWVVAPKNAHFSRSEIQEATHFQEQYFDTVVQI